MDYIVKRDAWHDTIAHLGNPRPRKLPSNFTGKIIKEGYRYYKFFSGGHIYFYQVTNIQTNEIQYEILRSYITGNKRDNRELFPWEDSVCDSIETFTTTVQQIIDLESFYEK